MPDLGFMLEFVEPVREVGIRKHTSTTGSCLAAGEIKIKFEKKIYSNFWLQIIGGRKKGAGIKFYFYFISRLLSIDGPEKQGIKKLWPRQCSPTYLRVRAARW